MNPQNLFNSRFNIETINNLFLKCVCSSDNILTSCYFSSISPETNDNLIYDNVNGLSYTFSRNTPSKWNAKSIKQCMDWLFKICDSIYQCCDCNKYIFEENFKGSFHLFRCTSCQVKRVYLEGRKHHNNIMSCNICNDLELVKNLKKNYNCCMTSDNVKYICIKCFNKISIQAEQDESEDDNDDDDSEYERIPSLFVPCPFCRGIFERVN